jgi:hypothetical protein
MVLSKCLGPFCRKPLLLFPLLAGLAPVGSPAFATGGITPTFRRKLTVCHHILSGQQDFVRTVVDNTRFGKSRAKLYESRA